jgi:hypothetical protein
MVARKKHPNKTIEEATNYAESKGWRYKKSENPAHAGVRCSALKRKTVAVLYQYGHHQRILKILLNQLNTVLIMTHTDKAKLA